MMQLDIGTIIVPISNVRIFYKLCAKRRRIRGGRRYNVREQQKQHAVKIIL